MNDKENRVTPRSGRPYRRLIIVLVIVIIVQSLLLALTIPSFVENRNTAAERACLHNLMLIEEGKRQADLQNPWVPNPVKLKVDEITNDANHTSDGIRQPADGLPKPSK